MTRGERNADVSDEEVRVSHENRMDTKKLKKNIVKERSGQQSKNVVERVRDET